MKPGNQGPPISIRIRNLVSFPQPTVNAKVRSLVDRTRATLRRSRRRLFDLRQTRLSLGDVASRLALSVARFNEAAARRSRVGKARSRTGCLAPHLDQGAPGAVSPAFPHRSYNAGCHHCQNSWSERGIETAAACRAGSLWLETARQNWRRIESEVCLASEDIRAEPA